MFWDDFPDWLKVWFQLDPILLGLAGVVSFFTKWYFTYRSIRGGAFSGFISDYCRSRLPFHHVSFFGAGH
jgi:hypothetical protein